REETPASPNSSMLRRPAGGVRGRNVRGRTVAARRRSGAAASRVRTATWRRNATPAAPATTQTRGPPRTTRRKTVRGDWRILIAPSGGGENSRFVPSRREAEREAEEGTEENLAEKRETGRRRKGNRRTESPEGSLLYAAATQVAADSR